MSWIFKFFSWESQADMKYGQFLAGMAALATALALAAPSFGAEKFAGDFLNLGSGARALGMGSAYVAVTDGAASSYYNPAGLMNLKSREASLMHSEEFGGMQNYNTLSIAAPLSDTEAIQKRQRRIQRLQQAMTIANARTRRA
jgi:hypothetical protein